MTPLLTVCISTNSNYSLCLKTLNSLLNQTSKDFSLIIQDNTPTEDKASTEIENLVKSNKHKYIKKKCSGLSESRNICIENCATKYIHFLDDDVHCAPDFVKNLLYFLSNKEVACVGGKVLPDWNGNLRPSWLTDNCLPYLSIVDNGPENIINPSFLVGANICFDKSLLVDLGGFSTNLGRIPNKSCLLSNEESQIIHLIKKMNLNVLYNPSFPVYHVIKKERLKKSWFIKRAAWQGVSDAISNNDCVYENQNFSILDCAFNVFNHLNPSMDVLLYSVRFLIYKLLKGINE